MTIHNAGLTSGEISQLWAAYQNDSMSICVLRYLLGTVEDPEIKEIIQYSLELSQSHIPQITDFFTNDNWAVPKGFTESDVNLDSPRLFTDNFMLYYIKEMGMLGVNAYSMAIGLSARQDVHSYFTTCISESCNLHAKANDLLLRKGLYISPPFIPTSNSIDFATNKDFLGSFMGNERPLLSTEIANLHANIQRNTLGNSLLTAFSQVAHSEKVQKYMLQGKEIAEKHIEIFSTSLNESDLPAPVSWDTSITRSTTSPFSDKLIMFHTTALIAVSIGYYGTSLASSFRKDLMMDYSRLIAEVMKYAGNGAKIMIDNGWLEEPPQAADRDDLAKKQG